MLSKQKAKQFKEELVNTNAICKLIRLGVKNLEPKIKSGKLEELGQIDLFGQKELSFLEDLKKRTFSSTYLMLIAEFERIFYQILKDDSSRFKENVFSKLNEEKFLDSFITFKTKKDFIPLSYVKNIYSKISALDVEYLSALIAIRNYIAHGKKEIDQLEKNDLNLINDTDTITSKLCSLLNKIIS